MSQSFHTTSCRGKRAFTLIEIIVAIAIASVLLASAASFVSGTEGRSRRLATDAMAGLIEQARSTAIATRSHVVLAIAEPGVLPVDDDRWRMGLFRVSDWPAGAGSPGSLDAILLSRWQILNAGVILLGGEVDGLENPMDHPAIHLRYVAGGGVLSIPVRTIAFTPAGALKLPPGSSPVVIRVAKGSYHNGRPVANQTAGSDAVPEHRLRVGRAIARAYRIDP